MSKLFFSTLREVPAEAEIPSHQLLLRAGIIRKSAAGLYTLMPLGQRVLRKIMTIIRQEMDNAGGQEVLLPLVQPAEMWKESGRWDVYGDEMFRLKDRHNREFCLGPTHEEIITTLVRGEVQSYRQLPLRLYQIQNKYRDEIRPRFGLIRSREFIMKDLYSFDRDEAGLDAAYWDMYHAYERIFTRLGFKFRPVEADSGAIGGETTHEFMVLAQSGEAEIVYCEGCDYAANVEKAEIMPEPVPPIPGDLPAPEPISTPNLKTIEELVKALQVPATRLLKTLIVLADGNPVAVVLRGDHQLNEIKLAHTLGAKEIQMADPGTVLRVTGGPLGFSGPLNLEIPIYADQAVMGVIDGVAGANAVDTHLLHVQPGRDFQPQLADLRIAQPGDRCHCGQVLQGARGIEVGQVFKLGTKYSKALGAEFIDENGVSHPMVMGCYGIGVTRTLQAAAEQFHDADGLIWPWAMAPFQVQIVPVNVRIPEQLEAARRLYDQLTEAGVEVLLDDRDERPGVKFKDADLIGIPIRLTIGPRSLAEGKVEMRWRETREESQIPLAEVISVIDQWKATR